jgi:hypothetical protein
MEDSEKITEKRLRIKQRESETSEDTDSNSVNDTTTLEVHLKSEDSDKVSIDPYMRESLVEQTIKEAYAESKQAKESNLPSDNIENVNPEIRDTADFKNPDYEDVTRQARDWMEECGSQKIAKECSELVEEVIMGAIGEKQQLKRIESEIDASIEKTIDPYSAAPSDVEKTLQHHSHMERKVSPDRFEEFKKFVEITNLPEDMTDSDIADEYRMSEEKIRVWREKEQVHRLGYYITDQEEKRIA